MKKTADMKQKASSENQMSFNTIALYEVSKLSPADALAAATYFFDALGIEPDVAAYKTHLPVEEQEEHDYGIEETTFQTLKDLIHTSAVADFSLNKMSPNGDAWEYAFEFVTQEFDKLNYLLFQYPDSRRQFSDGAFVKKCVERIVDRGEIHYGVAYQMDSAVDAQSYALGNNFVSAFSFDDPRAWQQALPYYKMDESVRNLYLNGKLRLVYRYNFLTRKHLNQKIEGLTLEEWIRSDRSRGEIQTLSESVWCWQVAEEFLQQINLACQNAGILIAYRTPPAPVTKRVPLP